MSQPLETAFRDQVLNLVETITTSDGPEDARQKIPGYLDLARDHRFLPTLSEINKIISSKLSDQVDIGFYTQFIADEMKVQLSQLTEKELGFGGLSTLLMLGNDVEEITTIIKKYPSVSENECAAEIQQIRADFQRRDLTEFVELTDRRLAVISGLVAMELLGKLEDEIRLSPSPETAAEHIATMAQKKSLFIDSGAEFVRGFLETIEEDHLARSVLPDALTRARERLKAGWAIKDVTKDLLDDENIQLYIFTLLGPIRTLGKDKLIEIAEAQHPHQGVLMRFALADDEAEAWQVISDDPGLFAAEAEQEALADFEVALQQHDDEMAEKMRLAATRLREWRTKLIDPQKNVVKRLADQVLSGLLPFETALGTLNETRVRTEVDIPYLGAIDELVDALVREGKLHEAEITASLNHRAAAHFPTSRIKVYAGISLALIWLRQGKATQAVPLLEEAKLVAKEIPDQLLELRSISTLGLAHRELGNIPQAVAHQEVALELAQRRNDPESTRTILGNLAMDYYLAGQVSRSKEAFKKLRKMIEESGDQRELGKIIGNAGLVAGASGNFLEAIANLEEAASIARSQDNTEDEIQALSNLGQMYAESGDLEQAEITEQKVLQAAQRSGNRPLESSSLIGLAAIALRRGEFGKAIEINEKALEIIRYIRAPDKEIVALMNLGVCHKHINQLQRAVERYQEAQCIAREISDERREANVFLALGSIESQRQNWAEAERLLNEAILRAHHFEDTDLEMIAKGDLAMVYGMQGQLEKAEEMLRDLVANERSRGARRRELRAIVNLGIILARMQRGKEAEELFQQGLALADQIEDIRAAYDCSRNLGFLYENLFDEPSRAADAYRDAIQVLERESALLDDVEEYEKRFVEDKSDIYRLATDCELGLGRPEAALDALERGRARLLGKRLQRRNLNPPNIPDELLSRYNRLFSVAQLLKGRVYGEPTSGQRRMERLADELAVLQSRPRDRRQEEAGMRQALEDAEQQLKSILQEIKALDPGFDPSAKTEDSNRWKNEVAKDPTCLIVVLYIGARHGNAIVVHASGITVIELPDLGQEALRKIMWGLPPPLSEWYPKWHAELPKNPSDEQLFALTMSVHFNLLRIMSSEINTFEVGWGWGYDTLIQEKETVDRREQFLSKMTLGEREAWDRISSEHSAPSTRNTDELYLSDEKLLALWQRMLYHVAEEVHRRLWKPLSPMLERLRVKRVVIIPDAQMQTLPLHLGQQIEPASKSLTRYDVLITPSLGIYADCARWASERNSMPQSLMLINPLAELTEKEPHETRDMDGTDLEARQLQILFDARNLPNFALRGEKATLSNIIDTSRVGNCWHFIGHARYWWWDPEQSGLKCAGGETLTMRHVQSFMDFRDARLVSLSACETGITQLDDPAQNYIGLFSGFLAAGIPTMLVSLWPVEDISTALLVEKFYSIYLGDPTRDQPPVHAARALREAQEWLQAVTCAELQEYPTLHDQYTFQLYLEGISPTEQPFSNPYYWAGFIIVGA